MSEHPRQRSEAIPQQAEMEARLNAKLVIYEDHGVLKPGGMCGCCGGGPNPSPDWRADPWYIYRAGICDADGVFYAMLCEGCLEDIRDENSKRLRTEHDELAEQVAELLGDDIDGAQTMMDDLS